MTETNSQPRGPSHNPVPNDHGQHDTLPSATPAAPLPSAPSVDSDHWEAKFMGKLSGAQTFIYLLARLFIDKVVKDPVVFKRVLILIGVAAALAAALFFAMHLMDVNLSPAIKALVAGLTASAAVRGGVAARRRVASRRKVPRQRRGQSRPRRP